MNALSTRRASLRIKGYVQGVFYRHSAMELAVGLGLKGFVRNLPDGDVEAVAEGPAEALEKFISWSRRGPPAARVEQVEVSYSPATSEFARFQVER